MPGTPSFIALLTDFGTKDTFVGILKGVIYKINPAATIVDLTHGIHAQDIMQASFQLYTAFEYFPENTIFCCVVDPGVGSDRKPILIKTRNYFFIGPDNGVLWMAAKKNGIQSIIHLTQQEYFLDSISSTFHGRDIFAPVCAWISKGVKNLDRLGPPLDNCITYEMPKIETFNEQMALTVIHIDRFGNVTLNITEDQFESFTRNKAFVLSYHDKRITRKKLSYSEGRMDELFLVVSSSSFMEICIKNDSAANTLNARCLDKLLLSCQK